MASNYKEITSISTRGDKDGFANSLSVWFNKPHVVNRRLCGAKIISCEAWSKTDLRFQLVIDKLKHLNYSLNKSDEQNLETRLSSDQDVTEIAKSLDNSESVASSNPKIYSVDVNSDHSEGISAESECNNCKDEKATVSTIVTEENKSVKAKPKGESNAFNELIEQVELESVNTSETEVKQQKQSECILGKFKATETNSGVGKLTSSANVCNTDADLDHRFGNDASEGITQVDGLAEYKDDVIVIIRELVPKQPDRHENIPELIIYGLLLFLFKYLDTITL